MFRVWGKIFTENRLVKDTVICIDDHELSRTNKVYKALHDICQEFDLAEPIWLENNKNTFICHARTRFTQDNFIEHIDFDYLDFHIIEEDY